MSNGRPRLQERAKQSTPLENRRGKLTLPGTVLSVKRAVNRIYYVVYSGLVC